MIFPINLRDATFIIYLNREVNDWRAGRNLHRISTFRTIQCSYSPNRMPIRTEQPARGSLLLATGRCTVPLATVHMNTAIIRRIR